MSSRSKNLPRQPPAAPPPYRPQSVPRIIQTKTNTAGPKVKTVNSPLAPDTYRPQPVPRVLQTKKTTTSDMGKLRGRVTGPPVIMRKTQSRIVTGITPHCLSPQTGVVQRAEERKVPAPPPAPRAAGARGDDLLGPRGGGAAGGGPARVAKNLVHVSAGDISDGNKFSIAGKVYTITGAFRKEDYPEKQLFAFNLDKLTKLAKFRGAAKRQEDLGLREKQQAEEAEKERVKQTIKAGLGGAQIQILGSAYRHNASGQKDSHYVGKMSNDETDNYIRRTIASSDFRVTKGKNGGHDCHISLGNRESIVFEYFDDGSLTVRHVGPGG